MECERQAVFKLADYTLPQFVTNLGKVVSFMLFLVVVQKILLQ